MAVDTSTSAPARRVVSSDVARFGIGARVGRMGAALADIGFAFVGAYQSRGALSIAQRRSFGVPEVDIRGHVQAASKTGVENTAYSSPPDKSPSLRLRASVSALSNSKGQPTASRRAATFGVGPDAGLRSVRSPDVRSAAADSRSMQARAPIADIRVTMPAATLRMVVVHGRTFFAVMPCR